MKNLLNKTLKISLLAIILMNFNMIKHPIKMSSTDIEYIQFEKRIEMSCSFFADDFKKALKQEKIRDINIGKPTKEDLSALNKYMNTNMKITVDNKIFPLVIASTYFDASSNLFKINFEFEKVALKKGTSFTFENKILFNIFGYMQTNYVYISIPPFVMQEGFSFTLDNYSQTYNF